MPVDLGQPLSERELEITKLVAEGLTNREIALRLFLSPNTIKVHLRNIFTKTDVSSRTELSMLAVQEGWITVVDEGQDTSDTSMQAGDAYKDQASGESADRFPPWSWQRWSLLVIGFFLIIFILLLPHFPVRSVNSSGPGQIFGPVQASIDSLPSGEEGRWYEGASLPVRRAGMGVASFEAKAYVVGGISAEGATGRLDIYNIPNDEWSVGEPRPVALGNVGAAVINRKILVPGGCDSEWIPQAITHIYDPATDAWEEGAPMPSPLCAYAIAAYQDKVFLFGGWNGGAYTAAGFVYDGSQDTWQTMASPTSIRGFGGAGVLADRVFYVGGYDGRRELDLCEVYSPGDDVWEDCPPMLQPRGGLGVASTTGRLYALGGGWDSFLGFNEQFSPESGQWTVMDTPMVGEWRNVGAFVWERSLYVTGGWGGTDFLNRTYVVEVMPWRVFMPGTFRTP